MFFTLDKDDIKVNESEEFSKLCLTLIKKEADKINKPIKFYNYKNQDFTSSILNSLHLDIADTSLIKSIDFDAILPSGLYDERYTIVQIKYVKESLSPIRKCIDDYNRIINDSFFNFGIKKPKLLIVSNIENIPFDLLFPLKNNNIELLKIDDLLAKDKSYFFEYLSLFNYLYYASNSSTAKSAINKYDKQITDQNVEASSEESIKDILTAIKETGISLILGTGVSLPYNKDLTWGNLVDKLYQKIPETEKFKNEKNSFEVLGEDYGTKSEFSKYMLKEKYGRILFKLLYPNVDAYKKGNSTLDMCADLIASNTINKHRPVKKVVTTITIIF